MSKRRVIVLLAISLITPAALCAWLASPRSVIRSAVLVNFTEGFSPLESKPQQSCICRKKPAGDGGKLLPGGSLNAKTQQVAGGTHTALPADFDWLVYLEWHPEIRESGVTTETAAKQHYLQYGRAEGRMYKRYCMVALYYSLSLQGLVNQWYVHLAALMLAKALGSELVLPPAMHRGAFAGRTNWFKDPTEALLDVEAIAGYWSGRGVHIHVAEDLVHILEGEKVSALQLRGNVTLDVESRVYIDFGKYGTSGRTLNETVAIARKAIVLQTEARMRLHPEENIPYLVLHFSSTFWPFCSPRDYDLVTTAEAARSLRFPPLLVDLAEQVLRSLTGNGTRTFNGLHLRIEDDVVHISNRLGGKAEVWNLYAAAMQQVGFSADTHIYVASGLDENGYLEDLVSDGLAHEFHHKAMYLSNTTLTGLNSEQRAAVDFLVLAQCRSFVGFGPSTFSFLLPQYKSLMGYPPDPFVLLSGVNGMFKNYGRVAIVSDSSVFE